MAAAYPGARQSPRNRVGTDHLGTRSTREPDDFTIATMFERFARLGDLHAGIDDAAHPQPTLRLGRRVRVTSAP